MKIQTSKKLFAFIIIMMFSVSFLQAQCTSCKKGEVSMYKCVRCASCYSSSSWPCGTSYRANAICVPQNQVQTYLNAGWKRCPILADKRNNKIQGKSLVLTTADNVLVSWGSRR